MAAQGADGYAVVGEYRLKVAEGGGVLEHRQLAVRVAGVIAGAQLDGRNAKLREPGDDLVQRQVGQQRGENADFHEHSSLSGQSRIQ